MIPHRAPSVTAPIYLLDTGINDLLRKTRGLGSALNLTGRMTGGRQDLGMKGQHNTHLSAHFRLQPSRPGFSQTALLPFRPALRCPQPKQDHSSAALRELEGRWAKPVSSQPCYTGQTDLACAVPSWWHSLGPDVLPSSNRRQSLPACVTEHAPSPIIISAALGPQAQGRCLPSGRLPCSCSFSVPGPWSFLAGQTGLPMHL